MVAYSIAFFIIGIGLCLWCLLTDKNRYEGGNIEKDFYKVLS